MKLQPRALRLLAVALAVTSPIHAEQSTTCPKTAPSGAIFGKPFPPSEHWYGSETLAVILPPDGNWRGMGPQHNYRDKLFWWSFGFKPGSESNLKVSARSLDGTPGEASISPPTNADAPSLGGWTMLVLVEFPAAGCWEITGEYLGQKLSFVVEVRADAPPKEGAHRDAFRERGRMAPDGLKYVASWVDEGLSICYQLMETDDRSLLENWMHHWADLVEFEVHRVVTSREAAERMAPSLEA
jgi:hypothetical protein